MAASNQPSLILRPVKDGFFVMERQGYSWVNIDFFDKQSQATRKYPDARISAVEPDLPPDLVLELRR